MQVCVHVHVCVSVCMCLCVHVCVCMCTCVCTVYMYVSVCACVCASALLSVFCIHLYIIHGQSIPYSITHYITVWDLGGQTSIRPYWRCYYSNTDAIIYVVDSADRDRLAISKSELVSMLEVSVHYAYICTYIYTT